ncbi:MAG: putative substrate-binding transporter protein component [Frankiales bacterium]|nr:putative substrate-binding transporter protein component [Frankiales bacterium]
MQRTQRTLGAVALGLSLTLVAACGSDDTTDAKEASATTGGGAPAAAASGPSAKVMVIGDITSTIPFTVPEIVPAAKGAFDGTNVEVVSCDAKGDPNAAQACARQAVSDGVVAVIHGFSTLNQDQSVLEKAGIAVVGNAAETSPVSYATSSAFSQYVAMGVGLGKQGCTKLGIIYLDRSETLVDNIKKGIESTGGKEVVRAAVAANAPDLTPAIAKITGAGAQCLALSLPPTGVAQAITAVKQSGKDLKMAGISAVFSAQLLKSLGKLTDGLLVVDNQESPYDPGTGVVKADMAKFDSKAEVTQVGTIAWVGAKIVRAALEKVQGEPTAASVKTALDGLSGVDLQGVIPPFTAKENTSPLFKRLMNPNGISYTISSGVPTRSGDFFDLTPILNK